LNSRGLPTKGGKKYASVISKVEGETMTERKLAELAAKLRASFDASGLDEKLAERTATLLKEQAQKKAEETATLLKEQAERTATLLREQAERQAEETATLLKEYAKELDERLKAILRKQ
jgi:spore germination cell wall hydrolase CwlJ-like protein